jgi:phosphatidylinositol alpha-mannosyltransferase
LSLRIVLTHVYAWPEVRRGGERYLHGLAAALAAAGHEVEILSTAPEPARSTIDGVPIRYLRRRHLRRTRNGPLADEAAFGVQAMAALAAKRFDVWHAMGTADAAAATVLDGPRRFRSVYTDHGFPNRASRERRPDRRLHERVVESIGAYVCVSEAAGRFLREGYGREPVVRSGGVDLAAFRPAPARHPTPALLFAGDASESRKNLPLLVSAFRVLRASEPAAELWVAGPGDQAAAVAAAGGGGGGGGGGVDHDGIRLLGSVAPDEVADLYGRAWVTVLPAVAEAFGLVLVESLACGTPIVALDEGGPAEIVRPGIGATGAATPEGLAAACGEALALARTPGIVDACRGAAAAWDWRTAVVPAMEAVYAGG